MGVVTRFRWWRTQRRINRILNAAGWPKGGRVVFSGNVKLDCVRYADFYVENYKEPRSKCQS